MRARSARRLSVLPARTQLSSVERSSGVKVRAVGYLLMPHHDIERVSLQLSTRITCTYVSYACLGARALCVQHEGARQPYTRSGRALPLPDRRGSVEENHAG